MDEIELLSIQNLPIAAGFPVLTAKQKGYPARIFSFGAGKQTGEHTRLEFSVPLTYAGEAVICGAPHDLFRIPEEGIGGRDLFNADKPLFLMLRLMDDISPEKWLLYRPHDQKCHTVRKVFNKYMPSGIKTKETSQCCD